jgi:hypothetical protein
MAQTVAEINNQIEILKQMFADYIAYNDGIDFTGENEKIYTTSETLLQNTEKTNYTAIQELEEIRQTSLTERKLTLVSDTTIYNVCFEIYNQITEDLINNLIIANDLGTNNRNDIDPNDPILKKGMVIIYYK